MIFSRRKGGRPAAPEDHAQDASGPAHDEAGAAGARVTTGPFDSAEAPEGHRLDLGSLQIPAIEGLEIRVQADPDGTVGQVVLVHGPSALQLGVFAAPRHEGIWDEVRAEIRDSLVRDGAAPQEVPGRYGVELQARVRTPDGPTDLRFVGVEGPRWLVRAVYQGPVAVDETAAQPLVACLEGLVVVRGGEAKPVLEPLPLRLPQPAVADGESPQVASAEPSPEPPSGRKPSPRARR